MRLTKELEKQPSTKDNGYKFLRLYKDKKGSSVYVHRLVAIAFLPNPENKRTVNHINGDKSDNRVENLEWATHGENNAHAILTGLNKGTGGSKAVIQMDLSDNFIAEYRSACVASRITGITRSSIQGCAKPHRTGQKTAGGFKWKFKAT